MDQLVFKQEVGSREHVSGNKAGATSAINHLLQKLWAFLIATNRAQITTLKDNTKYLKKYITKCARSYEFVSSGDYVYVIKKQSNGIDVNAALGKESTYPHEHEVAVPKKINSSGIKGARMVGPDNKFTGPFIKNPKYKG